LPFLVYALILEKCTFQRFSENEAWENILRLWVSENIICYPHSWLIISPSIASYVRNKSFMRILKALLHFHSASGVAVEKFCKYSNTYFCICELIGLAVCFWGYLETYFLSLVFKTLY
jgi:hypothetical protein